MVQWVKNLAAVAWVTVEAQVQYLARCSELKDLILPQLCHTSELSLRFNPWPRNFHVLQVQKKKKKKKERKKERKKVEMKSF